MAGQSTFACIDITQKNSHDLNETLFVCVWWFFYVLVGITTRAT
jgi:hypothetical protein